MIKILKILLFSLILLIPMACNYGDTQVGQDQNGDDNISADFTTTPSSEYPHTKPIVIQQAKYKYVVDGGQGQNLNIPLEQRMRIQQGAAPNNQQGTPAPQQQQTETKQGTPAPEQKAPAQNQAEQPAKQETQQKEQKAQPSQGMSEAEKKVIELTNVQRRKNGLPDLKMDTSLSNVAREKSQDMRENNYFSHTSPTYGSPFDMMRDFGISYNTAGENIANGQPTPEEVVNAWMNSEGHRKNILSAEFTHIGVGYDSNGHYWTQMFIGK